MAPSDAALVHRELDLEIAEMPTADKAASKAKQQRVRGAVAPGRTNKSAAATLVAVLCCASTVLFAVFVIGGCLSYEPYAPVNSGASRSSLNPLLPYDKILRRFGPLLPLLPPLLRAGAAEPKAPGPLLMPSAFAAVLVFAAVAAVRLALYLSLLPGGAFGPSGPVSSGESHDHWMSDHVFLGGSMVGSLATEGAALVAHLAQRPLGGAPRLWAAAAAAWALWLLTAADMHYTARFFHPPPENLRAWACSMLLFQAPLATWAIWHAMPGSIARAAAA